MNDHKPIRKILKCLNRARNCGFECIIEYADYTGESLYCPYCGGKNTYTELETGDEWSGDEIK